MWLALLKRWPLPALPSAWPNGSVKGLRARGGFFVDVAWHDGKVSSYRIEALQPGVLKLRVGNDPIERTMKPGDVLAH